MKPKALLVNNLFDKFVFPKVLSCCFVFVSERESCCCLCPFIGLSRGNSARTDDSRNWFELLQVYLF